MKLSLTLPKSEDVDSVRIHVQIGHSSSLKEALALAGQWIGLLNNRLGHWRQVVVVVEHGRMHGGFSKIKCLKPW